MILFRAGTGMARLYSLAVHPEMAGKGIGRKLLEAAEDAAFEHDRLFLRLEVREDNASAIALYLTDLFPAAGLGPKVGESQRGAYLSWLAWYGDVMEPVYVLTAAGIDHPMARATFRGMSEVEARMAEALADGRHFLLGDRYSAADLIVASPFGFFRDSIPADPRVRAWIERCLARPATVWANDEDARAMAA